MFDIKKIGEGAFHITTDGVSNGMLSRYEILTDSLSKEYASCSAELQDDNVIMHGVKRDVSAKITVKNHSGYSISIPLTEKERLFGLGDATRDGVMMRGMSVNIWVRNISAYGPIPQLMSSDGWAILINSTYKQKFDIGNTDKDTLNIHVLDGDVDFYLFSANSLKETLSAITDVTGKPTMLPSFGYGLTFVENEKVTGARELLDDVYKMREDNFPCDVIGLEPSWMETHYDYSNDKKWDPKRFYLNYWEPENQSGPETFFAPLRFMGMQLSLWLCEDYDFFYEEERQSKDKVSYEDDVFANDAADEESFRKNKEFVDAHLVMDKNTNASKPWFEHLKKFVDNGAACFKLDGATQVLEHPQRAWAEKFLDKEAHNIYPVVLAKQLYNGFKEHTNRRVMIYSAGGYAGVQKYAATWAGDTGGGPRTLVSAMNYAMCGHANTSCDINIFDPHAVHYGFLQSWSQINNWASHAMPWYLPEGTKNTLKFYSELRSSLFPYIYSTAHNASVTGMPILRPLPLVYEETDRFDGVTNAYMLGDSFYVGAFDMDLKLPDGKWIDYFTGKEYEGDIFYEIPEGKGGALFAKAGSVIGTMVPQRYINECEHNYIIKIFPGANASFDLYEDDGFSFGYESGEYAETHFELCDHGNEGFELTVGMRSGTYSGRPDNGHDIFYNSIPEIKAIQPVSDMKISIKAENITSVTLNGESVPFEFNGNFCEFVMPAEKHDSEKLIYKITY